MSSKTLFKALDDRLALLPCPHVASQVIKAASSPDLSAADLEQVILCDPTLAARMLKIANSPYYGLSQQILQVRHAIVLLGFSATRNVAVTAAMSGWFRRDRHVGRVSSNDIWRHSLRVAVAAQMLAERVGADPDDAFLAGLLHDLGVMAEFEACPDELHQVFELVDNKGHSYLEAERLVFGADHCRATHALLRRWSMPESLQDAVSRHHEPLSAEGHADALGAAVALAEALASGRGTFADGEPMDEDTLCDLLGVTAGELGALWESLKTGWDDAQPWD